MTSKCFSCGKTKSKLPVCAKCGVATYCDKLCQTKHWKLHKPDCKRSSSVCEVKSNNDSSNDSNDCYCFSYFTCFRHTKEFEHGMKPTKNVGDYYGNKKCRVYNNVVMNLTAKNSLEGEFITWTDSSLFILDSEYRKIRAIPTLRSPSLLKEEENILRACANVVSMSVGKFVNSSFNSCVDHPRIILLDHRSLYILISDREHIYFSLLDLYARTLKYMFCISQFRSTTVYTVYPLDGSWNSPLLIVQYDWYQKDRLHQKCYLWETIISTASISSASATLSSSSASATLSVLSSSSASATLSTSTISSISSASAALSASITSSTSAISFIPSTSPTSTLHTLPKENVEIIGGTVREVTTRDRPDFGKIRSVARGKRKGYAYLFLDDSTKYMSLQFLTRKKLVPSVEEHCRSSPKFDHGYVDSYRNVHVYPLNRESINSSKLSSNSLSELKSNYPSGESKSNIQLSGESKSNLHPSIVDPSEFVMEYIVAIDSIENGEYSLPIVSNKQWTDSFIEYCCDTQQVFISPEDNYKYSGWRITESNSEIVLSGIRNSSFVTHGSVAYRERKSIILPFYQDFQEGKNAESRFFDPRRGITELSTEKPPIYHNWVGWYADRYPPKIKPALLKINRISDQDGKIITDQDRKAITSQDIKVELDGIVEKYGQHCYYTCFVWNNKLAFSILDDGRVKLCILSSDLSSHVATVDLAGEHYISANAKGIFCSASSGHIYYLLKSVLKMNILPDDVLNIVVGYLLLND